MEKSKLQRIVGILVVISLVIVILPLLFGQNSTRLQAKTLGSQGESNLDKQFDPKDFDLPLANNPLLAENDTSQMSADSPTASTANTTTDAPQQLPQQPNETTPSSTMKPEVAPPPTEVDSTSQAQPSEAAATVTEEPKAVTKPARKAKMKRTRNAPQNFQGDNWIVQMGSFKNKANAERLTHKLQSAGFKAYSYDIQGAHGVRTRVFVGPESNHEAARQTAKEVYKQLNIQGYVVVKPMNS